MSNHRFHGDWTSTRIGEVGGTPTAVTDDRIIHLEMTNAATGEIQAGSNHDRDPITGPPITADFIDIEQTGSVRRSYKGFLIANIDIGGGRRVMVVSGRWKNLPLIAAQEEGTWVATKTG